MQMSVVEQSVHTKFDERIAVLTGDALIVSAFDTLAGLGPWLSSRSAWLR